jgi:hypothetical protein
MDFAAMQSAWKQTPEPAHATGNDDLVRAALAADRRLGRRTGIRDLVELGTAVAMAAGLAWMGTLAPVRWPWIGAAAGCLAVAAVFVVERWRAARPARSTTVRAELAHAVAAADHQIALLRSVLWWYLLPIAGVVLLILTGTVLGARAEMPAEKWAQARFVILGGVAVCVPVIAAAYYGVWWLNQRAVTNTLAPHRAALADLLRQLDEADHDTMTPGGHS